MIEVLNGMVETVNPKDGSGFKMYDNTEYESYPAHWHPELEIIMPLIGPYIAEINGMTYRLREKDIIFIGSGVIHILSAPTQDGERIIFQPSLASLLNVYGMESVLTMLPSALLITPESDPDIHDRIYEIILEMRDEYFSDKTLSEASVYSLLIEMVVLIGRKYSDRSEEFDVTIAKKKEYSEKFTNICNYINEHFAEDLSLEDIAERANFSKYHFTRLFKQFTGYSFYKYLNRKRIECAEKLLINPDISITDVAMNSGFTSLSAFIRMFKQMKGCTPTEFRNMYRH